MRAPRALLFAVTLACSGPGPHTEDAGPGERDGGSDAGPAARVEWPNAEAQATSDPWIVDNHDRIEVMRPRVLALDFVNARGTAEMEALFESIFAAIREATRPHGEGEPFLQYEIARSVDLRDEVPPADWPYRNSTLYPREDPPTGTWGFDYEQLFGERFAELYGFEDPDSPGRYLTLCELSERGLVHDVWIYGDADVPDAGAAPGRAGSTARSIRTSRSAATRTGLRTRGATTTSATRAP